MPYDVLSLFEGPIMMTIKCIIHLVRHKIMTYLEFRYFKFPGNDSLSSLDKTKTKYHV